MNRRDLFKMFGGAAGIPAVQSIERLDLKPEDVIVIKYAHELSKEQAERIRQIVTKEIPGRKVLVLSGGMDIAVLRNA